MSSTDKSVPAAPASCAAIPFGTASLTSEERDGLTLLLDGLRADGFNSALRRVSRREDGVLQAHIESQVPQPCEHIELHLTIWPDGAIGEAHAREPAPIIGEEPEIYGYSIGHTAGLLRADFA